MADPCPCGRLDAKGRPLAFAACCGPFLAGAAAPDPESLMRSRYTAFVREDVAYLQATWHPRTRPAQVRAGDGTRWLGLEVRQARRSGDEGEVEFVARYRVQGRGARLHERSRFLREDDGRWYYLEGVHDG